jgi:hypothetical protein
MRSETMSSRKQDKQDSSGQAKQEQQERHGTESSLSSAPAEQQQYPVYNQQPVPSRATSSEQQQLLAQYGDGTASHTAGFRQPNVDAAEPLRNSKVAYVLRQQQGMAMMTSTAVMIPMMMVDPVQMHGQLYTSVVLVTTCVYIVNTHVSFFVY